MVVTIAALFLSNDIAVWVCADFRLPTMVKMLVRCASTGLARTGVGFSMYVGWTGMYGSLLLSINYPTEPLRGRPVI